MRPVLVMCLALSFACATPKTASVPAPVAEPAADEPAPPGSPVVPFLGTYRVVELVSPGAAAYGPLQGGVVGVHARELVLYNDPASWNRMAVNWNQGDAFHVSGVYPKEAIGPSLVLRPDKKLVVSDADVQLAVIERLGGDEEKAARKTLAEVPSIQAMQERTRECIAAFAAKSPTDPSFRNVRPEAAQNTGALYSTLQIAQQAFAMRCLEVPQPCVVPPNTKKARDMLERAKRDCAAKAR